MAENLITFWPVLRLFNQTSFLKKKEFLLSADEKINQIYIVEEGELLINRKIAVQDEKDPIFEGHRAETVKLLQVNMNKLTVPMIVSGKNEIIDDAIFEPESKLSISCFSDKAKVHSVNASLFAFFLPEIYNSLKQQNSETNYLRKIRHSNTVKAVVAHLSSKISISNSKEINFCSLESHVKDLKKHAYHGLDLIIENLNNGLQRVGKVKKIMTEGIFSNYFFGSVQSQKNNTQKQTKLNCQIFKNRVESGFNLIRKNSAFKSGNNGELGLKISHIRISKYEEKEHTTQNRILKKSKSLVIKN